MARRSQALARQRLHRRRVLRSMVLVWLPVALPLLLPVRGANHVRAAIHRAIRRASASGLLVLLPQLWCLLSGRRRVPGGLAAGCPPVAATSATAETSIPRR